MGGTSQSAAMGVAYRGEKREARSEKYSRGGQEVRFRPLAFSSLLFSLFSLLVARRSSLASCRSLVLVTQVVNNPPALKMSDQPTSPMEP